eukprot:s357_g16.t1
MEVRAFIAEYSKSKAVASDLEVYPVWVSAAASPQSSREARRFFLYKGTKSKAWTVGTRLGDGLLRSEGGIGGIIARRVAVEGDGEDPSEVCVSPAARGWEVASGAVVCRIWPQYLLLNSLVPRLLGPQNLKERYGASWSLVTGGSSGIGKELARKLLSQGLNLIIIARDEPIFEETLKELKKEFPKATVRSVKANLSDSSGSWMADVKEATKDIDVQVVFNNAGFIVTGFFEQHSVETHLANFHCNLTANIHLTHYLYSRLISKGLKGCIVFTSSSAGFIPNPFAAMYGCTKSGLSELAASLAVEGKARGVDVHAVHPSPVNSRFTAGGGNDVKVHKMNMFDMAYKMATGPEELPNQIFACVGRSPVMIDLGGTSVGMRLMQEIGVWPSPAKETSPSAPAATTAATAAPAEPSSASPMKELSPEQLAKLSKEERKAYHEARRAQAKGQAKAEPKKQLTKAERRQIQEEQRKVKEASKDDGKEDDKLLADLKLQGLSEDQARAVMLEMRKNVELDDDEFDEDGDPMRDFNMQVRFQGHVDTTPTDHLGCLLSILFEEACSTCISEAAASKKKLQPMAIAKKLEKPLTRWAPISEIGDEIGDPFQAADVVCSSSQTAAGSAATATSILLSPSPLRAGAIAMVGCLVGLREADLVEDDELLQGCRRMPFDNERPIVLEKFMEDLLAARSIPAKSTRLPLFCFQDLDDEDEDD